jgi:GT2 family glycosyltransferase
VSGNGKVVIGYVCGTDVKSRFMECLIDLDRHDEFTTRRLREGGGPLGWGSGVNVSGARNALVKKFLEDTQAEWLLFLDTDMTFGYDLLERLLAEADPEKAPIVGGLCFGNDNGRYFPTLYDLTGTEDDVQFVRYDEWQPDAMMQVFATGAACLLIHRTVLERIRDYPNPHRPGEIGFSKAFPWFQETDFNGRIMGEDITFCLRAGTAGYPVFVNTAVQLGHIKDHALTMDGYLAQRGYLSPTHPGVPA